MRRSSGKQAGVSTESTNMSHTTSSGHWQQEAAQQVCRRHRWFLGPRLFHLPHIRPSTTPATTGVAVKVCAGRQHDHHTAR